MDRSLYNYIFNKEHHAFRRPFGRELAEDYAARGLSPEERMADRLKLVAAMEEPRILKGEQIVFLRTVTDVPHIFTPQEWEELQSRWHIHELGYMSNVCPDYARMIGTGLEEARRTADGLQRGIIDAILDLADRYRAEAERTGREDVARILARVPRYGAAGFREALQAFRIYHYFLWLEGDYHNTIGRFDQFMYPYLRKDLDEGVLTDAEAQELLDDFFLSFNKDSDLYTGVQQGDNGQSMMLGGRDSEGRDTFNRLSEMCLVSSRRLGMIDPKLNIRVNKDTPFEVYRLGTQLTKAGLGFPQYSNDDRVIPALIGLGYDPEDARDYTVAACWEFIIPGKGRDITNISALNLPLMAERAIRKDLASCRDFEAFFACVEREIREECDRIVAETDNVWFIPSPWLDMLMDEIKYRNYGIHGTGIASCADSLTAIKKYVFDEKTLSPERILRALETDYADDPELLHLLRYETPKMGRDEEEPDLMARRVLDAFGSALRGRKNKQGGIWKGGTATAMYYLWHAAEVGATPDGRRKNEPFGTNFSPNLFTETRGPLSVIRSFTRQNFDSAPNGGPLTLEFAGGIFFREDSIDKVAALVQYFIQRGGHQLQLNSVNPEAMRDAQLHPENHRSLVVRIWGWSAYFVELDKEYQDHVIARQEYTV